MTSIIIPAYNAEKYLQAAIESVISQSDSDWELILVDDGSTDSTPEICDKAASADPRIRAIHTSNRGVSAARNKGIDESRGDFIAFLDADDLISPDFIQILKDALQKKKADLAASPLSVTKNPNPSYERVANQDLKSDIFSEKTGLVHLFYQTNIKGTPKKLDTSICGKLFPKNLLHNIRFKEGIRFEDLDVFYQIVINTKKIAFVPYSLYFYRQHNSSFIHNYSPSRLDVLDVTDRMVENISDFYGSKSDPRHSELITAARTRRFAAHCNILLLLLRNGNPAPEALERCKKVIKNERGMVLRNKDARLKDRLGALLSYLIML